jgi:hypothetical protein
MHLSRAVLVVKQVKWEVIPLIEWNALSYWLIENNAILTVRMTRAEVEAKYGISERSQV